MNDLEEALRTIISEACNNTYEEGRDALRTTIYDETQKATAAVVSIVEEEKKKMTETLKWCDDASCGKNMKIAELGIQNTDLHTTCDSYENKIAILEGENIENENQIAALVKVSVRNTIKVEELEVEKNKWKQIAEQNGIWANETLFKNERLREALERVNEYFNRNNASGNFIGDEEHETWGIVIQTLKGE